MYSKLYTKHASKTRPVSSFNGRYTTEVCGQLCGHHPWSRHVGHGAGVPTSFQSESKPPLIKLPHKSEVKIPKAQGGHNVLREWCIAFQGDNRVRSRKQAVLYLPLYYPQEKWHSGPEASQPVYQLHKIQNDYLREIHKCHSTWAIGSLTGHQVSILLNLKSKKALLFSPLQ